MAQAKGAFKVTSTTSNAIRDLTRTSHRLEPTPLRHLSDQAPFKVHKMHALPQTCCGIPIDTEPSVEMFGSMLLSGSMG